MKVFYDTNIILEYLFRRKEGEIVRTILLWSHDNQVEKFLSSGSFYTLTYLIEKGLKNQGLQDVQERRTVLCRILSRLLQEYTIIGDTNWTKAINDISFSDLEDSYQHQTALTAGCNILLTLNIRDFKQIADNSTISILTPAEFIDKYCKNISNMPNEGNK